MRAVCLQSRFHSRYSCQTHEPEAVGNARVGFTAMRVSHSRRAEICRPEMADAGRATARAGFPGYDPIMLLHGDSAVGEVVPELHVVVEFVLPHAFSVLSHPDLRQPVRRANIDGIATTQYLVEYDSTKGPSNGLAAAQQQRSPDKACDKFVRRDGSSQRSVGSCAAPIGIRDVASFKAPRDYTKLP